MAINHVLVLVDSLEDETTGEIINILEMLPVSNTTNFMVIDRVQSAIDILSEIKPTDMLN